MSIGKRKLLNSWSAGVMAALVFCAPALATSPPTFTQANAIAPQSANISLNGPPGATIYFTTDGSQPTVSTNSVQWTSSSNAIEADGITQINAIATLGGVNSTVASCFYIGDARTAFLPPVSGALGWFCPCYGSAASGAIASWPDLSGAGHDLTQSTSGSQPTLNNNSINGQASVNFNGTSSCFQLPSLALSSSGLTLFAVVQPTTISANAQILNIAGSPSPHNLVGLGESSSGAPQFTIYNSSGSSSTTVTGPSSLTAGQYHLIEIVQGDIASTTCTMFIDGQQVAQNTSMLAVPSGSLANNFVGCASAGGNYFSGNIAQLVLYGSPLTTSQRIAVENYLLGNFQVATLIPTNPIISVASGTLAAPMQVAIAAQPNATIRFTVDGTTPGVSSPVYSQPVQINYSQTLKAIAISDSGGSLSGVASASYTLDPTVYPAPATGGPTLQFNITQPAPAIP